MTRFLIEVPHEATKDACEQAIRVFMETGSHFVTHADWGCSDHVHKAWIVADLESKDQALSLLPPLFRRVATVVALEQFGVEDLHRTAGLHAS
ncbi:MAG: hypothetical protein MUO35_12595 [Anaerolineales bacterium]|nr:hypothetical protein [Anaerolineales bacterium]